MGLKTKNLELLLKDNLNVFEYKEVHNKEELEQYIDSNDLFTIRFDREYNIQSLPFYIYSNDLNIDKILEEANKLNCTLLCSNGYKYDDNLLFNFVISLDDNNDFILELCNQKVPLRKMYNYETTIIRGNIFDDKYEYINKNSNSYTKKNIESIFNIILNNNFKYKYLEGTIYDIEVGILKSNIIIWQTD